MLNIIRYNYFSFNSGRNSKKKKYPGTWRERKSKAAFEIGIIFVLDRKTEFFFPYHILVNSFCEKTRTLIYRIDLFQ